MTAPCCPSCGKPGRRVKGITLRSLVQTETLRELESALGGFAFCASSGCDVAYFAEDGRTTIDKACVRVRIGVKETVAPKPLCYCFDITAEDVAVELSRDGATNIPEQIAAKCKAGLDRCPETNPRGACCLGDIRRAARG